MNDDLYEKSRERIWEEYDLRGGDDSYEALRFATNKFQELNDQDYLEEKLVSDRRYIEISRDILIIAGVLFGACLIYRGISAKH